MSLTPGYKHAVIGDAYPASIFFVLSIQGIGALLFEVFLLRVISVVLLTFVLSPLTLGCGVLVQKTRGGSVATWRRGSYSSR